MWVGRPKNYTQRRRLSPAKLQRCVSYPKDLPTWKGSGLYWVLLSAAIPGSQVLGAGPVAALLAHWHDSTYKVHGDVLKIATRYSHERLTITGNVSMLPATTTPSPEVLHFCYCTVETGSKIHQKQAGPPRPKRHTVRILAVHDPSLREISPSLGSLGTSVPISVYGRRYLLYCKLCWTQIRDAQRGYNLKIYICKLIFFPRPPTLDTKTEFWAFHLLLWFTQLAFLSARTMKSN